MVQLALQPTRAEVVDERYQPENKAIGYPDLIS